MDYRRMAENIAWGYPTGSAVLLGWLGSGVGLVGTHWTHELVTM